MNTKEVSELRRRFVPDKSGITKLHCCYVNAKKEILSVFEVSLGLSSQAEQEKYLSLLKKSLSGGVGRNLIDIPFSNADVSDGEYHKLLTTLRDTACSDVDARMDLFTKIAPSVSFEDKNALILLAADAYDVPVKKHDAGGDFGEESDSTFRYIICAVCPVVPSRDELCYTERDKSFHMNAFPRTVAAPELGFLFPAFDSRAANIYNALCYSKSAGDVHADFIDAVFHIEKQPMSAVEQKETFTEVLEEALDDACSLDVVQTVHEQIRDRIEAHKESRDPDPLDLTPGDVGGILEGCGIGADKVETFKQKCAETFGALASLDPNNIVDVKRFDIVTPQVKITVDPEYAYMVEHRIIDGKKYIMIAAEDGVSVNGVGVEVKE